MTRQPRNLRQRRTRDGKRMLDGWYGKYKDAAGRWREVRIPGNLDEARERLRELERDAFDERKQFGGRVRDMKIDALRADWKAHVRTHCKPRTWESYELGLEQVLDWLGRHAAANGRKAPELVRDLRPRDLTGFAAAKRDAAMATRTVNMRVGAVVAMCRWGVGEGLMALNPLATWKPLRGPRMRVRRALTPIELMRLLQASPEPYRTLWRVVLGTGLRSGELAALERRDVDMEARELTVRGEVSKSKRPRTIPLRADVAELLRAAMLLKGTRQPGCEELVFVNSHGGRWAGLLSRRLKTCRKRAGLPDGLDVHSLRHTFGSHLIASGADVKSVQELLGHSSAMVTLDVYAHGFADRKREAIERLSLPGLGGDHVAPVWRNAAGQCK